MEPNRTKLTLLNLAVLLLQVGGVSEVLAMLEPARPLAAKLGGRSEAHVLHAAAQALLQARQLGEAEVAIRRELALSQSAGDLRGEAMALGDLGRLEVERGRWGDGVLRHGEAARIAEDIGERRLETLNRMNQGVALLLLGRYTEAAALYRVNPIRMSPNAFAQTDGIT